MKLKYEEPEGVANNFLDPDFKLTSYTKDESIQLFYFCVFGTVFDLYFELNLLLLIFVTGYLSDHHFNRNQLFIERFSLCNFDAHKDQRGKFSSVCKGRVGSFKEEIVEHLINLLDKKTKENFTEIGSSWDKIFFNYLLIINGKCIKQPQNN